MFDLTQAGAAQAIGALPSLAIGNEPRPLTQEWARAIYVDQPAGPDVTGIRYRMAYNFGSSLALWDCDDGVEIVSDAYGQPPSMPLTERGIAPFSRADDEATDQGHHGLLGRLPECQ